MVELESQKPGLTHNSYFYLIWNLWSRGSKRWSWWRRWRCFCNRWRQWFGSGVFAFTESSYIGCNKMKVIKKWNWEVLILSWCRWLYCNWLWKGLGLKHLSRTKERLWKLLDLMLRLVHWIHVYSWFYLLFSFTLANIQLTSGDASDERFLKKAFKGVGAVISPTVCLTKPFIILIDRIVHWSKTWGSFLGRKVSYRMSRVLEV